MAQEPKVKEAQFARMVSELRKWAKLEELTDVRERAGYAMEHLTAEELARVAFTAISTLAAAGHLEEVISVLQTLETTGPHITMGAMVGRRAKMARNRKSHDDK